MKVVQAARAAIAGLMLVAVGLSTAFIFVSQASDAARQTASARVAAEVPQSIQNFIVAMQTSDGDLLWSSYSTDRQAEFDMLASYYYGYETQAELSPGVACPDSVTTENVDGSHTTTIPDGSACYYVGPGLQAIRDAVAGIAAQGRTLTAEYVGKYVNGADAEYIFVLTFTSVDDVQSYAYTFFADDTGVTAVE